MKVLPVDLAQAHEMGLLESRQSPEDSLLITPFESGLEAHQVVVALGEVLLAQLHDGMGPAAVRRGEADGLHGSETQGVDPSTGDLLDGQTSFEEFGVFEAVGLNDLGPHQPLPESLILLAVEGDIEVIVAVPLAVAGAGEELRHLQALRLDDGSDGVIEVEVLAAQELQELLREGLGGQGTGGEDRISVRDLGDFPLSDFDLGVLRQGGS